MNKRVIDPIAVLSKNKKQLKMQESKQVSKSINNTPKSQTLTYSDPSREEIEQAKVTADHMAQVDMQEMEALFANESTPTGETGEFIEEAFEEPENQLSTPDEFFSHLWKPCFNGLTSVSGYKTFAMQADNKTIANIIYRKIADNPYLRPILDTKNASYADLLHIAIFIVGLVGGLLGEYKLKKQEKLLKAQQTREKANEPQQAEKPIEVKTDKIPEEDIERYDEEFANSGTSIA